MAGSGGTITWNTRFGFLMAAIGSSVGLGNFWRFPYMAGENGGSAFVLIYLACVALIAFPILIAELSVGRHARRSAVGSTRKMAFDAGASEMWSIAGWVAMAGGVMILCFYSVVAGWVAAYVFQMASGAFVNAEPEAVASAFGTLVGDTSTVIGWHTLFMAVTITIVCFGVTKGIERAVTILMPIFFLMLVGLVVYAGVTGDMGAALTYLFTPDFSEVTGQTVIAALGQAFFSIGVGSAIMITYGSYLRRDDNLPQSAGIITGADAMVAIIAGLAIFPFVFAFGLDPAAGAGLFFETLPSVFAQMPGGQWLGTAFFALAFIAALTSSISLLQVIVSFGEEHTDFGRVGSSLFFGAIIFMFGVGAAFSVDGFFDVLDKVSGNILLPLGGLLIAVFTGWVVSKQLMLTELNQASAAFFAYWRFTIRWLAPVAVALIILVGLADMADISLPYFGEPEVATD
ncbi:sodium-dependent transporter [Alkalicaulis satelles]|uniref:Sodium-dependent transporter n=1 Tax=Alkalicaulis satelles TaxID=2609175 RepID=A0A5M6ZII1_9PROT|nr:sodium-dependent transporter [Alkalicaulis satelles]KAA5804633.1 sodium-dependent transporter [Alkalicaulis satelles]